MRRVWRITLGLATIPGLAVAQGAVTSAPPAVTQSNAESVTVLPEVNVIGATPLLGSGVDRYKVPAENQVFPPIDITQEGMPGALNTLQDQAQGVSLNNASGGPLQPNLLYHGFQAGPLQGTEEGLAVYVNGVRFNQAFGDTVNWDLIPDIAIDRMNLEGANPVFGLNALGGSLAVQMKNGFTYHGAELDVFGGSFDQVGGEFQYGKQSGNTSVYVAGAGLHEDGWRYFQSTGTKQFYGDVGWRSETAEVHLNIDAAQSLLAEPGTTPVQWLDVDPKAQFTGPSPDENEYLNVSLNGNFQINPTTSVQALAYYDYFLSRIGNGNSPDFTPCNDGTGLLCEAPGVYATTKAGTPILAFAGPSAYAYSDYDSQITNTNGYGASLQLTNRDDLFGHHNHFVGGFSFDGSDTLFDGYTMIGGFNPITLNYMGPGIIVDQADGTDSPVRVGITSAYYGVYATDIFDITSRLSANVAGRFNAAQVDVNDWLNTGLTGNHTFNRFNPAAGLTYKVLPGVGLYGGYSESNRAPTPAELTCASPAAPCSLANFFTGDPPLKQVISRSIEFGLRGQFDPYENAKLNWNLSAYRSNLNDDIIFVQSVILGRGYFQNIGDTRRQGIDAGVRFNSGRWTAWANYSYIDATFQSGFTESSPENPGADANGNIQVKPGVRLPGIPANLL